MNSLFQIVDARGRTFPLYDKPTRIGRNAGNDVVLADSEVSRHHATIFTQGDQLYLRDENSKNGTWLNGQRVTGTQPLKMGDRVRIGRTEFIVQMRARAQAWPAAEPDKAPGHSTALPYVVISTVALVVVFLLPVVMVLNKPQPMIQAVVVPTVMAPSVVIPSPTALATASLLPVVRSPAARTPAPQSQIPPSPTATDQRPDLSNLPPPLANMTFPSRVISYPADWPQELRYPDLFKPVAAGSGNMPAKGNKSWVVQLIYDGSPKNARTDICAFLTGKGWQIVDHAPQNSNGFQLFTRRGQKPQTGVILIGPDSMKPGRTKVLATITL